MPTKMEDLEAAARQAGALGGEPDEDLEPEDGEAAEEEPEESDESPEASEDAEQPEGDDDTDPYEGLPETFFGENIHAYADEHGVEAAKAHHKALEDANRVANSRLQEIAELRKQLEQQLAEGKITPQPDTAEEAEELSDEELLESFGYDPALLQYGEFGKPTVDMLRRQVALEKQIAQSTQESQAAAWEQKFWGTFSALEADENGPGPIPYAREVVEEFAAERQIFDPTALYWSIMGPIQVAARKSGGTKPAPKKSGKGVNDLKKAIGGGTRKRSSATGTTTEKHKGMTLAESLEAAKKKLGVTETGFTIPE